MTELLLGIDIGTASSKAVLVTPNGEIVASATTPHEMSLPHPGWAEMDAEQVWWGDVLALTRELVNEGNRDAIAGMCVSGVGPCLLLCDEDLTPQRPAILYGIDMRSTDEIAELTERLGAAEIVESGGTPLSTQAVGPKMLWVQRKEPDVWNRSARWFNSSSFVVAKLTGEYVLDHHTASQCDPLYDINSFDWLGDWVDEIAPGVEMPRLAWPSEIVGQVTRKAAQQTGLRAGTPVAAGTVDAWAEAISVGVRKPGDLMLMYGSTMFFVQVLPGLRTSPLLWTTAGVEPQTYTAAAGMATSGSLTTWMRDLMGGVPFETLIEEASVTQPGADGLLILPYFAGERTPVFDPDARGVIAGLSLRHSRGHVFRATYEGIAFGIKQILGLLDGVAQDLPQRIVAVGGGTKGGLWTQIVSDVTGRSQIVPKETIGACFGDAWMAGVGVGLVTPETEWVRDPEVVQPDPKTRDVYEDLFAGYEDLYRGTRDVVHLLARRQRN
jgi:xylulokinase